MNKMNIILAGELETGNWGQRTGTGNWDRELGQETGTGNLRTGDREWGRELGELKGGLKEDLRGFKGWLKGGLRGLRRRSKVQFFFHEYGRHVGGVPRSSLKGKETQHDDGEKNTSKP